MTQEEQLKQINNYYLDCIAKYSSSIMYDGYFMNIKKLEHTETTSIKELHPIVEDIINQYLSEANSYGIALEYKNKPTKEITIKEIPFTPISLNDLLDLKDFNQQLFDKNGNWIFSESKLSQWFINTGGTPHKYALDSFLDLLLKFIDGREYTLYELQDNESNLIIYQMDLKKVYCLVLQIKESNNHYNNYMLHCCIKT